MIARFWLAAAIASIPATAFAQNLTDTHERVSTPGKTISAYRPIERNSPVALRCHPDATKAVACEATARHARAAAQAGERDMAAADTARR